MSIRRTVTTFPLMGTTATLVVGEQVDPSLTVAVCRTLRDLEARLTVNGPPPARARSQVEAINRAAGEASVRVDPDVYDLVRTAVHASRRHRGSFNALIGPVVKAWGIGFEDARVPSAEEIDRLLPLTDPEAVEFDDGVHGVALLRAGMRLDLGAIAKGYAADRAADVYRAQGIDSGLIDLGGNVVAMGGSDTAADGLWRVGIQSPFHARGTSMGFLRLRDSAVVTSGVYERFLDVGERRFHHMIDPLTGRPFDTDLASVTVICADAVDADLWATVAQRGGLEGGRGAVEAAAGVEAVFVTVEGRVVCTTGVRDALTLTPPDREPEPGPS